MKRLCWLWLQHVVPVPVLYGPPLELRYCKGVLYLKIDPVWQWFLDGGKTNSLEHYHNNVGWNHNYDV